MSTVSTAAVAGHAETPEHGAVRTAAQRAAVAAPGVRSAGGPAVDAALRTMATALRDRTADLLAANAAAIVRRAASTAGPPAARTPGAAPAARCAAVRTAPCSGVSA